VAYALVVGGFCQFWRWYWQKASSYLVKKEFRGEFTTGLWYQNGLFFPIIILVGLFGPQNPYLPLLFLFTFLHPTVMFSTYMFFYSKKAEPVKFNMRRLINPVLVTTIMGLGIALIGLETLMFPNLLKI